MSAAFRDARKGSERKAGGEEMRGKFRFLLSGCLLAAILNCSDWQPPPTPKDDPGGFRNITWETHVKQIRGLQYLETRRDVEKEHIYFNVYTKIDEELELGSAKVDRIEYWFWRGTLARITVNVTGKSNFAALKQVCFKKFGQGKYSNSKSIETGNPSYSYQWRGSHTEIQLCWYTAGTGVLWLTSNDYLKERESYLKKEIKEGEIKVFEK